MGKWDKLYSSCHFRGIFNVNLSTALYDTNSTDRDEMIKAFEAQVACKPNLNVNFTEKMQFITPSRIDHDFSSRRNYWYFFHF